MDDKPIRYPATEEKMTDLNKESGTYSPPEKYNVNKSNGDSNDDNSTDNSRTNEGNA